ncbi:hypothetical protein EOPP23_02485 [Endozoicomonas sp. OPT23]|uniref:META domain-containing protein n=1 Tax=Endozoicomonas sp. OPT23 TaxID=2072845 RepID=UPI00129A8962|nr:META domain-containing protein [Endozoicomonas sp. OPT23]MRI31863.1 hypothetical protein [Endozoicomonas sp. OPT23]
MWKLGRYSLLLTAGSMITACGMLQEGAVVTPAAVEEKTWVLLNIDGQPPIDSRRVTLTFDVQGATEGRFKGKGPCNNYFGNYKIKNNELTLVRPGSTRLLCLPEIMQQEDRFLSAFQGVDQMLMSNDRLIINNRDMNRKLVFIPESEVVSGKVKPAKGSFPAGTMVRVQLRDNGKPGNRYGLIGEQKIRLKHRLDAPLQFELPYAPSLVQTGHSYSVYAEVRHKGKLISQGHVTDAVNIPSP